MKFAILVGDGMSDRPLAELDGKTPLEVAKTKNMNEMAREGEVGCATTIPRGMSSGSDVANLSLMGYDPKKFYTGRGPLEAANMGIELGKNEIAFRCNLITASGDTLADYSAGHITDKEARILIEYLNQKLGNESVRFHAGKSYRHLLALKLQSPDVVKEYARVSCVPPHNIVGQQISRNLPRGKGEELLTRLMKDSKGLLERHEINKVRIDLKENPANMIWLWGQGTNPNLPTYKQLFGLTGSVISAVDLIKGIGRLVGLDVIDVPGATGYYDTNYKGKGEYAIEGLRQKDFVFVHVEAPDEAGHNGEMRAKIEAIENFDKYIVGPVWKFLKESRNYRVMILPDHATPISVRTHVDDPVPFVICGKLAHPNGAAAFNENAARATRLKFKSGFALTDYFIHHDRKRKR